MAALGVPEPSEECDSRYGSTYLARWRATGREVCAPPPTTPTSGDDDDDGNGGPPTPPPAATSRVYCAAHPGAELTTCVARNLVLADSEAFMGTLGVAPGTVPPEVPAGAPGSVRLACRPLLPLLSGGGGGGGGGGPSSSSNATSNSSSGGGEDAKRAEAVLKRRLDQDGPKQWLRAAFPADGGPGAGAAASTDVAAACAGRGLGGAAVERPVLLLTRTDGLNAFHTTEGLLSVFSALAVAAPELRREGILPPPPPPPPPPEGAAGEEEGAPLPPPAWAQAEVVLADQAWPGPFLDIWRRIAAGAGGGRRRGRRRATPPPPRDGREAADAPLVRHLASRPFAAGTCLRRAVLLPYTPHGQSLLTYTGVGSDGRCGASPVAFGAALWLRHALRGAGPDGRGALLAAAAALERAGGDGRALEGGGGEGSGAAAAAAGEPFAHDVLPDGVDAPTWYARHRERVAAAGGGGGLGPAAALARSLGRRFGAGDGAAAAAAATAAAAANIVPPFAPHLVRLKLVWISRAHHETHGAKGRSGAADPAAGADAGVGADAAGPPSSSSSWQRQRRLSPAADREVVLALQEAVLSWNARACALQEADAGFEDEEEDGGRGSGAAEQPAPATENEGRPRRRRRRRRRLSEKTNNGTTSACRPLPVLFELEALELSDLPFFPDQAHALTRAGVLVGVHGAGLANMLLMRPGCGAVVEVWHNMRDNFHYQNLAALLAHGYARVEDEERGRVDVAALAARAAEAMDRAAGRHVAAARALLGERRRRRQERARRRRGQGAWGFQG